ncbi:hypothetical protein J6G99_01080 [bacterium]|nr:hypothetical protein [bacterium]
MALFIGLIRRRELKQQKFSFQGRMLDITKAKSLAAKSTEELTQVGTQYEADSLILKKLEERKYKLHLLEQKLDLEKEELETRIAAIDTELKSVEEMINQSIEESFSYKAA